MYIDKIRATIALEQEEINCIGYSILHDLKNSVKTHYVNHEMRVFDDQTRLKQQTGKEFFGLLGMTAQWEAEITYMKKLIDKANEAKP